MRPKHRRHQQYAVHARNKHAARTIPNAGPTIAAININVARVLLNNTVADSNNIRAQPPLPSARKGAPNIVLHQWPLRNGRQCKLRNVRHAPRARPAGGDAGVAGVAVAPVLARNRKARHIRIISRNR